VVVGFVPVVIGYGNGIGAPWAYIAAGALVALISTGFFEMARSHRLPQHSHRRPRRSLRGPDRAGPAGRRSGAESAAARITDPA
jgi:hypothetical protein